MGKILGSVAVLVLAASAASAALPVEGLWQTPTRGGQVEIAGCGQAICGRLVSSERIKAEPGLKDERNRDRSLRGRRLKDLQILSGFTGGPSEWKGGRLYNPDDGGVYKGSIRLLNPDQLKLTGCIVAPLCKTQTWTRVR